MMLAGCAGLKLGATAMITYWAYIALLVVVLLVWTVVALREDSPDAQSRAENQTNKGRGNRA
jgi:heme/copper-type cytochrome/quinol oxidase subunit 2